MQMCILNAFLTFSFFVQHVQEIKTFGLQLFTVCNECFRYSDQTNVCVAYDECSSDDEGECDYPRHVNNTSLEQDNFKNQLSYDNTALQAQFNQG